MISTQQPTPLKLGAKEFGRMKTEEEIKNKRRKKNKCRSIGRAGLAPGQRFRHITKLLGESTTCYRSVEIVLFSFVFGCRPCTAHFASFPLPSPPMYLVRFYFCLVFYLSVSFSPLQRGGLCKCRDRKWLPVGLQI